MVAASWWMICFLKFSCLTSEAEEQGPVERNLSHEVFPVLGTGTLAGVSLSNFAHALEPWFIHKNCHASNKGNQEPGSVLDGAVVEPSS